MKRIPAVVVVFMAMVAAASLPLAADSIINEVGISVSFSPSRTPILLGLEIGISGRLGWTQVSLMLSPSGGTILHGAFLLPVGGGGSRGTTHLAFAVALLERSASDGKTELCFGGGLSQRYGDDSGWMFAAGIEFLVPSFLTMPLFLLQGGWRIV
jgi:hypothetical protein